MKQKIRAELDIDGNPYSVAAFKTLLDKAAASIGADEHTGIVFIELEQDSYDSGSWLNAWVYREETDVEERVREEAERLHALAAREFEQACREQREIREFERLKQKFGQ